MKKIMVLVFLCVGLFLSGGPLVVKAEKSARELEREITNRNNELKELEREAQRIRREIAKTGSQKASLKRELALIAKERRSLENTIRQTRSRIQLLNTEILKNKSEIGKKQKIITLQNQIIESLMRRVHYIERESLLENILGSQTLSYLFAKKDTYLLLQPEILKEIELLKESKRELGTQVQKLSEQQNSLEQEKLKLSDQNDIIQKQAQKKQEVIRETNNRELQYQQNLKKTLKSIQDLDREIRNYESRLKFVLNRKSLPKKGSEPFAWPLKKILITQRFGKTTASGRLYKSGSHSGMDFRAAIGTPLYATADGVVKGTGNTDLTCPRASFGKWIFIEHSFGLSSTYGHLSKIKVREGQRVKEGDLIGYTGNTGHTTGPHLHITVYATNGVNGKGVRVVNRPSAACPGKKYRMPLAPTAAYLDPLDYFPKASLSMFKHPSLAGA